MNLIKTAKFSNPHLLNSMVNPNIFHIFFNFFLFCCVIWRERSLCRRATCQQ